MKYDILVVGAGLSGSSFAFEAARRGLKVLVIDKRNHIGGNCYTKNIDGTHIHIYGPHIFNTNDEETWRFVNALTEFRNYRHKVIANIYGKIFSLPINLMTIYEIYGVSNPSEARKVIACDRVGGYDESTVEGWCLSNIGTRIYETLIREYTIKQWGKDPSKLPASIIKRIPFRYTFDDNYYNHTYQGMPINGYTSMFEVLLSDCSVVLGEDYFDNRDKWNSKAKLVIYTGPIDRFFRYQFGVLEYRTLEFKMFRNSGDYNGIAQVNYPSIHIPYTREVEHAHFYGDVGVASFVTQEIPSACEPENERYYPVRDKNNEDIYMKYVKRAGELPNIIFLGRLGEYKYINMDQAIMNARRLASAMFPHGQRSVESYR